jgi:hypothetical protein
VACEDCKEWILGDSGTFGRKTDDGRVSILWHTFSPGRIFGFDTVSIYFQYDKENTVIINHFSDATYKVLMTLNTVLPITRQLLQELPTKLGLWITFS